MSFDDKKYIASKIKEYRKLRNLTQEELAEKINIGTKQISRIEVGAFYPSITTFLKIVEVLDIDMSDFISSNAEHGNKLKNKLIKIINCANEDKLNFYYRLITFANDEISEAKKNILLKKIK